MGTGVKRQTTGNTSGTTETNGNRSETTGTNGNRSETTKGKNGIRGEMIGILISQGLRNISFIYFIFLFSKNRKEEG